MSKKKGKKKSLEVKDLETKELIKSISEELEKLTVVYGDIVDNYIPTWRKVELLPPVKLKELEVKMRIVGDYIGSISYETEKLKEVSKNG